MPGNPKISIIIPVYNTARYLRPCLDSVINQPLTDIEIICINDGSTDESLSILQEYSLKDSRIKLIDHKINRSVSQARKSGVDIASGKYTLFIDGDDTLEPNACGDLYNLIVSKDLDVLHFGINVVNGGHLPDDKIRGFVRFSQPFPGELREREIFDYFLERKYGYNLWGKLFKTDLCKKAYCFVADGYYPKAEDLYAFFMIAFFAKSYYGASDKKYYNYYLGRGITGLKTMDLEKLKIYCSKIYVTEKIKQFLLENNMFSRYAAGYERIYHEMLNECVESWYKLLSPSAKVAGYNILVQYLGVSDVESTLAGIQANEQEIHLNNKNIFIHLRHKIIGFFRCWKKYGIDYSVRVTFNEIKRLLFINKTGV